MGKLKLREELRGYIEFGDRDFLQALHNTAKSYIEQKNRDRMIEDGEKDIEEGRVYSQDSVQQMIEGWTKK